MSDVPPEMKPLLAWFVPLQQVFIYSETENGWNALRADAAAVADAVATFPDSAIEAVTLALKGSGALDPTSGDYMTTCSLAFSVLVLAEHPELLTPGAHPVARFKACEEVDS